MFMILKCNKKNYYCQISVKGSLVIYVKHLKEIILKSKLSYTNVGRHYLKYIPVLKSKICFDSNWRVTYICELFFFSLFDTWQLFWATKIIWHSEACVKRKIFSSNCKASKFHLIKPDLSFSKTSHLWHPYMIK